MPTMPPAPRPPPDGGADFEPFVTLSADLATAFAAATAAATLAACLVVSVAFLAAPAGCFAAPPPSPGMEVRADPASAAAAAAAKVTARRSVSVYAVVADYAALRLVSPLSDTYGETRVE